MSLLADRLKSALSKEAYVAPPPPPQDPNAGGAMPMPPPGGAPPAGMPPIDPNMIGAMLGALGGAGGAPAGGPPPPADPNALPPPMDGGMPPQVPSEMLPPPTGGDMPVMLNMADLEAILAKASAGAVKGESKDSVSQKEFSETLDALGKRLSAVEDLLAQVLQGFGLMPTNESEMPANPADVSVAQKTAEASLNRAMLENKRDAARKLALSKIKNLTCK